jgi:hypothetical protein
MYPSAPNDNIWPVRGARHAYRRTEGFYVTHVRTYVAFTSKCKTDCLIIGFSTVVSDDSYVLFDELRFPSPGSA